MKSVIKLVVLAGSLALISGCVGNSPQYVYKPASYSSQSKTPNDAAEYCSYIAENKMRDTYDKEISARRARLDQQARDKERRDRESASNNSTTTCQNVNYGYGPARVECRTEGDNYGYQSGYNKQYVSDFSLPIIMNKSTNYDRAYRDCMVNEGYKRVEVKKYKRKADATNSNYEEYALKYQTPSNSTTTIQQEPDFARKKRKDTKKVRISSADARLKSAVKHLFGKGGVDKDYHKAFALLKKSVEQDNNPGGYFWLATMYAKGRGVEKDKNKARELFAKAARLGSPLGRISVLDDYVNDINSGISLNKETAKEWLSGIVKKRNSSDKDMDGTFLRTKKISNKIDELTAALQIKKDDFSNSNVKTTSSGNYWGNKFYNKGNEYYKKRDYENAIKWFKKSLDKGLTKAKRSLLKAENKQKIKLSQQNKRRVKDTPIITSINTTGNWNGTWISANGKDGGAANLTLIQKGSDLTGLFSIKDSPCLKSGSIIGKVSNSNLLMDITSGSHQIKLSANDVSSKTISGSYITTNGKCKGSKGSVVLISNSK